MFTSLAPVVSAGALVLSALACAGGEPNSSRDPDEQLFNAKGMAHDTPRLVKFLREQSGSDIDLLSASKLIGQLGDPSARRRQEAATRLVRL